MPKESVGVRGSGKHFDHLDFQADIVRMGPRTVADKLT